MSGLSGLLPSLLTPSVRYVVWAHLLKPLLLHSQASVVEVIGGKQTCQVLSFSFPFLPFFGLPSVSREPNRTPTTGQFREAELSAKAYIPPSQKVKLGKPYCLLALEVAHTYCPDVPAVEFSDTSSDAMSRCRSADVICGGKWNTGADGWSVEEDLKRRPDVRNVWIQFLLSLIRA